MSSLHSHEKRFLLEIARAALTQAVERKEPSDNLQEPNGLGDHGGAFVTLFRRGRLRGCIGQIDSSQSLVQIIARAVNSAALEDPRFDPVLVNELSEIEIELSILSPLEDISPDLIEAGKHGLIVSRDWMRGVLLPQVACEHRWGAERFLEETCVKAGLQRGAWRSPETKIQAFTAEIFREADFQFEESTRPQGRAKPRYSIST